MIQWWKKNIVERDLAYSKYNRGKNNGVNFANYKRIRNQATLLIRRTNRTYAHILLDKKLDAKTLWKNFAKLGLVQKDASDFNNNIFSAMDHNSFFLSIPKPPILPSVPSPTVVNPYADFCCKGKY